MNKRVKKLVEKGCPEWLAEFFVICDVIALVWLLGSLMFLVFLFIWY